MRNIPQLDQSMQACKGSANEDHFAMGITFAIANLKCARDVKRTIKTSDTALLFIKSFTITILDTLINCEFLLTHSTMNFDCFSHLKNNLCTGLPLVILQPPNKFFKNHRWRYQQSMMSYFQRCGQSLTLAIWRTLLCSAYYFTVIPLSTCT